MILIGPGQGDSLVLYDHNKNYDAVLVAPSSADLYWSYVDEPADASRFLATVPLDTDVVVPLSTEIDRDITIRAITRSVYSPATSGQPDFSQSEQVTAESDRLAKAVLGLAVKAGKRFARITVDNWNRFSRVRKVDVTTDPGFVEYTTYYFDLDRRRASGGPADTEAEFNELPDYVDIEREPPNYPADVAWATDTYYVRVSHSVQSSARAVGATYQAKVESLRYSEVSDVLTFDFEGVGAGSAGGSPVGLPDPFPYASTSGSGLVDEIRVSGDEYHLATPYRHGLISADLPYGQYLSGRKIWTEQQIFADGAIDDWTRDGGNLGPIKTTGLRTAPTLPAVSSLSYHADTSGDHVQIAAKGVWRHDTNPDPARYHFYRSTHLVGVTDDPPFFDTALALGRVAPAVWTNAAWRYSGRIDFALEEAIAGASNVVPVAVDIYGGSASSDTTDATGTRGLRIDSRGNAVMGVGALAVDSVGGYAYLPQFVGTPTTSAPAATHTGYVPVAMVGTAIVVWNGAAWVSASGSGANPAGSGSELQFRSSGTAFGAVTGSSVSGANVTLTGSLSVTASDALIKANVNGLLEIARYSDSLYPILKLSRTAASGVDISDEHPLGAVLFYGQVSGSLDPLITITGTYNSTTGNRLAISSQIVHLNAAVGVGTPSPETGAAVQVRGARFVIDSDSATRFAVRTANASLFSTISVVRSLGTLGSESVPTTGAVLGLYGAAGWNATDGWLASQTGTLYFASKETTWSATAMGTAAFIQTTPVTTNGRLTRFAVEENGDVICWVQTGAIAPTATNGNLFVPHTAGTPTGVPTYAATYTAAIPVKIDSVAKRIYGYIGSAWENLGGGGSGSPAGSGTEIQYRVDGSTFGAVSSSSVSGANITLGGDLAVVSDAATIVYHRVYHASALGRLWLQRGRGTAASPTAVQSGDLLYRLDFVGQYDTGTTLLNNMIGASIGAEAQATWDASNTPTDVVIRTKSGISSSSGTVVARFTHNQRFGVGSGIANADIDTPLHVLGAGTFQNSGDDGRVIINNTSHPDITMHSFGSGLVGPYVLFRKAGGTETTEDNISNTADTLGGMFFSGRVSGSYTNLAAIVVTRQTSVDVMTLAVGSRSIAITSSGLQFVLGSDAAGDTYYRGSTFLTRVAIGTSGHFYKSNGSAPGWSALAASDIASGELALARGGTGASLADPNADRILFWDDSAGAMTWMTANIGLEISGANLNFAHLGIQSLSDPAIDRLMFWDDSAGVVTWLELGTNLSISGTILNAAAGSGGYATIQDEASPLTARTTVNFIGNVVAAVDNPGSTRTDITINAVTGVSGSGTELQYRTGQYTLGAITSSSVSGANVTFGGILQTLDANAGVSIDTDALIAQTAAGVTAPEQYSSLYGGNLGAISDTTTNSVLFYHRHRYRATTIKDGVVEYSKFLTGNTATYTIQTRSNDIGPNDRVVLGGYKALVDNTRTDIFSVVFDAADHKAVCGTVHLTVIAKQVTGSNQIQVYRKSIAFLALHNAATNTGTGRWGLEVAGDAVTTTGGITFTFECNTVAYPTYAGTTNTLTYQLTANTDLTTVSEFFVQYNIELNGEKNVTLL